MAKREKKTLRLLRDQIAYYTLRNIFELNQV